MVPNQISPWWTPNNERLPRHFIQSAWRSRRFQPKNARMPRNNGELLYRHVVENGHHPQHRRRRDYGAAYWIIFGCAVNRQLCAPRSNLG